MTASPTQSFKPEGSEAPAPATAEPIPDQEGYRPEWLELERTLGTRPLLHGTPTTITTQFRALVSLVRSQLPPPSPNVSTHSTTADGIPVRIYTPKDAPPDLPIGVYTHGGGWVVGDLDSEDIWCRYLAEHVPCVIVSVDYRLGPEYKMPVMLEDCVKAFLWTHNNAPTLTGSQSQPHIFTIGGSAGGGLALSVANEMVATGQGSKIKGVVAMTPVTTHPSSVPEKYKSHYTAYEENGTGVPIIDAAVMNVFFEAVEADCEDQRIFTTLSPHLSSFPPTYIATCGKDPLRDDGKILEMMLKDSGAKTKSDFYDGMPHYYWMFPALYGIENGGERFLKNCCEGVRFVLGV